MTMKKLTHCDRCGATSELYSPNGWIKCKFQIRLPDDSVDISEFDFCSYNCLVECLEDNYIESLHPKSLNK